MSEVSQVSKFCVTIYHTTTKAELSKSAKIRLQEQQVGAEMGQAQFKLKLASIRICLIKLISAKCYQPLHIPEHD